MRLSNAASSRPVSSQVQRSLHTLIKINIRAAVFNGPNLLPLTADRAAGFSPRQFLELCPSSALLRLRKHRNFQNQISVCPAGAGRRKPTEFLASLLRHRRGVTSGTYRTSQVSD